MPYLENITNGRQRAAIVQAISLIPEEERTKVISIAVPYLENITDGGQRAAILRIIPLIPEEEIPEVINKLVALFNFTGFINKWSVMANMVASIEKIPAAQRPRFIRIVRPYLENITGEYQRWYSPDNRSNT